MTALLAILLLLPLPLLLIADAGKPRRGTKAAQTDCATRLDRSIHRLGICGAGLLCSGGVLLVCSHIGLYWTLPAGAAFH